tara:strand:+ start:3795 stop:4103 length:309 start_codon:yes stop_codon:yes gene_type:complete
MSSNKLVQELILFYIKENYNKYLKDHNINKIPDNQINMVISNLYTEKKEHLKEFLKGSLKKVMKEDYIGDLALLNICTEIFNDDNLCKNRLIMEIRNYQNNQ